MWLQRATACSTALRLAQVARPVRLHQLRDAALMWVALPAGDTVVAACVPFDCQGKQEGVRVAALVSAAGAAAGAAAAAGADADAPVAAAPADLPPQLCVFNAEGPDACLGVLDDLTSPRPSSCIVLVPDGRKDMSGAILAKLPDAHVVHYAPREFTGPMALAALQSWFQKRHQFSAADNAIGPVQLAASVASAPQSLREMLPAVADGGAAFGNHDPAHNPALAACALLASFFTRAAPEARPFAGAVDWTGASSLLPVPAHEPRGGASSSESGEDGRSGRRKRQRRNTSGGGASS